MASFSSAAPACGSIQQGELVANTSIEEGVGLGVEGDGYAKPAVSTVGFLTTRSPYAPLDLDSDKELPIGQACNLSGEGTCEACQ